MDTSIAVIGAGMGGLVLARVLAQHGVAATVYEREAGPGQRSQGGSLDLHPDTGQRALALAGLEEEFRRHARVDGEELRVFDKDGRRLGHRLPATDDARPHSPEIDRPVLRDLLRASLPEGTVQWGHRLLGADPRPEGGFVLRFEDREDVVCDLLIGADGGRSAVRPLLSDVEPHFVYDYVEMHVPDVAKRAPQIAELVGGGSLWAFGDDMFFGAQRNGDGGMRVALSAPGTEGWMHRHGVRAGDPDGSRRALHAILADWSPTLTQLIDATDDVVQPRPITSLPAEVGWAHSGDVTLLGDAAHVAPPTGDGANLAMLDGALLALALVEGGAAPDGTMSRAARSDALARYEDEMFPRASADVASSLQVVQALLAPGAAAMVVSFLTA